MNPSERIKAALSRPETSRRPATTLEPAADVETTLPLLGEATRVASNRAAVVDSAAAVNSAPPVNSSAQVAASATAAPADTPDRKVSYARHIYLALTALVLLSVTIVVIRERFFAPKPPLPSPNLQVAVQPEGTGLLSIRWNAQSTPIARAREGRLVVMESNQQPKVVQLQAEELKIGHVYYQSNAERLEFRLEVTDAAGAITKESVLALSGSTAGTPAPQSTQTEPMATPASKSQVPSPQEKADRLASATLPTSPATVTAEAPKPSQPAPRTFTPPPIASANQPVQEARPVVLDPSASLPGGITAPARVNLPQLNVLPPPTVKAPAQKTTPTPNRSVASGGNVVPATLLSRVSPVYPPIARTARIQGTVRFTATVDRFGKLQNIQLVSGPHMLVQAATDAVKQWVYRPMILNGQPTEVITQIEVKFALAP